MKGLFIPEITAEMFRNGCLEAIEDLMAAGEIYDVDIPYIKPGQRTGRWTEMMTLDEAIVHCEEVAKEQDKLCKRYDDASGYTRSHNKDIRTTDAKRCEECAKEHRQLAVWLKELKGLREVLNERKRKEERN